MTADNDANTIKPVESLQNIPVLTPTKRREQRKRRRQPHRGNKKLIEHEQSSLNDERDLDSELTEKENDENTIDYCA
jgi:hypothetical protein